jgi:hypothetical protein
MTLDLGVNNGMSDLQKENKKEADESEEARSMVSQTHPALEGEIEESGVCVRMTRQNNEYGYFTLSCMDEHRDWFQVQIRVPKKKFKRMRI